MWTSPQAQTTARASVREPQLSAGDYNADGEAHWPSYPTIAGFWGQGRFTDLWLRAFPIGPF
jgi:hypothetical protein